MGRATLNLLKQVQDQGLHYKRVAGNAGLKPCDTQKHLRDERGFSALEVAAVLGIIATLIAIVVPNVSAFMRESKVTRAEVDLRSIGQALMRFKQDLGRWPIFTDPEEDTPDVRVLVGPGENPEPGDSGWILPMMGGVRDVSNQVDTLEGQLVKNLSRYPTSFVALPWQGPYLQGLKEDPLESQLPGKCRVLMVC